MDRPTPHGEGPLASARALGQSLLALFAARVELIDLELKEEAQRRKHLLVLVAVASIFLISALLLLAFLVVAAFWETHRLTAIAGVTLAYAGIGAGVFWRFHQIMRDAPPPFSATLGEFRRDLEMIRSGDE